ncbi:MAG: MFS transporter [Bacillota bacterium]
MSTSQLSGPAKRLLTVQALYILAGALAGIFVNIFLWQTRTLRAVTIYNLFFFTAIPVFFIVGGILAKAYRRSWGFTLGALLHTLFYSLLLVWATEARNHLGLLGTLAGAATGFSWINQHILAYDLVPREQRDRFFGLNGLFNTVSTLVGPLVAGFIIYRLGSPGGYRVVFGVAVAVFLVETALSLRLRSAGGDSLSLRTAFSLHAVPGWERALASHFAVGIRDGVMMTVGPILIYALGANTLDFGRFNSLFALLTTGAYFLAVRLVRPHNRPAFLALGSRGLLGRHPGCCGGVRNAGNSGL